ncbi:MAG: class I SAM-dependent methyltransferase [Micavibrio sp.]|nr:class I SAM-dependent methyltransferase [Micavibrio sp.]
MAKTTAAEQAQPIAPELAPNAHVARQYEAWVYPAPIMDLAAPEHKNRRDGGDFERNFYTYWPDREKREDLDVLVAGCGSNAAARYAYNHPQARVTGLDLSAASLAHEAYLKDKHNLANLTLQQGRLEDVAKLGKTFDFIDCSGVLHHLPDPVSGLRALGEVLKPDGTIAIMVYGQYGRTGVYMLQEMFRLMELGQTPQDVEMVKHTLASLPASHAVQDYARRTRDTKYDAGLVDNFLHRQDRAYTTTQCVQFAEDAGLKFMSWWDNVLYYPEGQLKLASPLYKKISTLPEKDIWAYMELYNGTLGQHAFTVCRKERAESSYTLDFDSDALLDYTPAARAVEVAAKPGTPEGSICLRRGEYPVFTLSPIVSAIYKQIDGNKTVRECMAASGVAAQLGSDAEQLAATRTAFRYLWRLGHIFLRLPAAA